MRLESDNHVDDFTRENRSEGIDDIEATEQRKHVHFDCLGDVGRVFDEEFLDLTEANSDFSKVEDLFVCY